MRKRKYWSGFVLLCVVAGELVACTAAKANDTPLCDPSTGGIILAPTATRPVDPDPYQPAQSASGSSSVNCGNSDVESDEAAPEQFVAAEVVNLSLDIADQELAATAVGDDMLAVAWLTEGEVVVALSRGGNHFQVRPVDRGNTPSLLFSPVNRLHLVYEQDGRILYRAADQGTHPADPSFTSIVAYGTNPQVALDDHNWAHIIYEVDGTIWHATQQYEFFWDIEPLGSGHTPTVYTLPPNDDGLDFAVTYLSGNQVHTWIYGTRLLLPPGWATVRSFPVDDEPLGAIRLHSAEDSGGNRWFVAGWVGYRPVIDPQPLLLPPLYAPVNPLAPTALANAEWLYSGLNAAQWSVGEASFDAGLYQTIPITTGAMLTFSAWGRGWSSDDSNLETVINPANLQMQIGIDPMGGVNVDSPDVVWSATQSPLQEFASFTVTATAVSDSVTLFLRAQPDAVKLFNSAVWDTAVLDGGVLQNGDFEELFVPYLDNSTLTVPDGWTPFYADDGVSGGGDIDQYLVTAAWSNDGGNSWSAPSVVVENRELSVGLTGAIRPDVYPQIALDTEPSSVSFVYIYEKGNPPLGSNFIRYGRPHMAVCTLGTTDCTESPGLPLLPREIVRPTSNLVVTSDPLNPARSLLTWDGLQTDFISKDVYTTYLVLR